MDVEPDQEPLELLAAADVTADPRAMRREIARQLLELARSDKSLEQACQPGDVAAAFLRRYDNRRATQEAYSRDLADWFVWLEPSGRAPIRRDAGYGGELCVPTIAQREDSGAGDGRETDGMCLGVLPAGRVRRAGRAQSV